MKKLIVGNWKMNGSQSLLLQLANNYQIENSSTTDIVVCPPALLIHDAVKTAKNFFVEAQDCSHIPSGAYTGDLSAEMFADFGVTYVIVGHFERRRYQRETNDLCATKVKCAQLTGLKPVFSNGESKAEYKSKLTLDVLVNQLESLKVHNVDFGNLVIAYEPIWSIGPGLVADEETIGGVIHSLRNWVIKNASSNTGEQVQFLYEGSVTSKNFRAVLHSASVDGLLVGGASLDAEQFEKIVLSAAPLSSQLNRRAI